jgi:hypothetical protein
MSKISNQSEIYKKLTYMQEIGVLHVPAAITPEIIITNSEQLKQRK